MSAMRATLIRSFIASIVPTSPHGPESGLQSSSTSWAVIFSIFWQSLAAANTDILIKAIQMQKVARMIRVILQYLKSRNNLYKRIGEERDDNTCSRIYKGFPGFFQFCWISLCCEKLIRHVEWCADYDNREDSPEESIFYESEYGSNIRYTRSRSVIRSDHKIFLSYCVRSSHYEKSHSCKDFHEGIFHESVHRKC